jgi:predicted O-linked N-acetylglucosamine transferase (SPINDLY family)
MCLQYEPGASAREMRAAAAVWGRSAAPPAAPSAASGRRVGRLRVGYVSADFLMHPVGWFFLPVARHHDQNKIETFCYANQSRHDALTDQLEGMVGHWRDIRALDDAAACELIAADGIDVLVDLSGHTSGNRLGIFARRPAPLQFAWLGYFASTGLAAIDAAIFGADQVAPGSEAFFVEPVERLARSHFCYAPPAYAPAVRARPEDAAPVFGSFSNAAKLNDDVLRTWAGVLAAVPGSRLVLKWKTFGEPAIRASMHARLERAGCAPDRVELRGPTEHAAMLDEYGDIDIALDPYPFSGALTTCEALWMGVPVVTLEWQRPVARQTLALLRCIGLDDLVAATPAAYIDICRRLAADRARLRELRATLRERIAGSALMDGAGMAGALEEVYFRHARQRGLRAADAES